MKTLILLFGLSALACSCTPRAPFYTDFTFDGGDSDSDSDMDSDGDADAGDDSGDTDTDTTTDTESEFPATCAEYLLANPGSVDGEYTIYVENDGAKPWSVYCHNLSTAPTEYLTLINTNGAYNFAQYTVDASSSYVNVRTYYYKLRINPITFEVAVNDDTFSASTGSLEHGTITVTSMCYTVAMNCVAAEGYYGLANIDLVGTPLKIIDTFCAYGMTPYGEATMSAGDQVVEITGGGHCGWWAVCGNSIAGPFNGNCTGILALEYIL